MVCFERLCVYLYVFLSCVLFLLDYVLALFVLCSVCLVLLLLLVAEFGFSLCSSLFDCV